MTRHSLFTRLFLVMLASLLAGKAASGTLYQEDKYHALISDRRAEAVGDKITIVVKENTTAISGANTNTERSVGLTGALNQDVGVGLSFDSKNAGTGQTQRSDQLTTNITATVVARDDNGDMIIRGSKQIAVNNERQDFSIEGRVRSQDLAADNTVQSNKLADVKIVFTGDGDISAKQHPGLITRVLDWLGLP